jgi:hypothetical protein
MRMMRMMSEFRFPFSLSLDRLELMNVSRDDDDDEGDEDDDEEEVMTEAERMEEGRRMFQIFAARMFEQRVLTAYREKVSLFSRTLPHDLVLMWWNRSRRRGRNNC